MSKEQTVFIVDDDEGIRDGLSLLLETVGLTCETFDSAFAFLESGYADRGGCLVLDIRMPRMTGLDLQVKLQEQRSTLPIIFITGHGDIAMAVEAMRRGALDFIGKPFREQELLDRISEALEIDAGQRQARLENEDLQQRLASLTARESEVFERIAAGAMNKVVGYELGISERTVEVHRAQVMKKLGAKTLAEVVRMKIQAEGLATGSTD